MAILVPYAMEDKRTMEINGKVGLSEQEIDRWGQIPGSFQYSYSKKF